MMFIVICLVIKRSRRFVQHIDKTIIMKRFIYILGMALTMCCCTSKEENTSSSTLVETKSESGVNYLYSHYDFRKEDPGCKFSGFSCCEKFGRWSEGDTSIVNLRVAPMSEITVRMDVDRVISPDTVPFEFNVFVNESRLAHFATGGNISVYMNVPKENVGADGSLNLMLVYENATQPSKINPNLNDDRKLGFGLKGVTIYGYSLKK